MSPYWSPNTPPKSFAQRILSALQGKPVYTGTVPKHVKADRRAKDKVAKASRKTNR